MRTRQAPAASPPGRPRPPERSRRRVALPRLVALVALCAPVVSQAQALSIPEYRELILSQETKLARLDRELTAANEQLDQLVAEKAGAGSPRGERSRQLSAEIVEVSER